MYRLTSCTHTIVFLSCHLLFLPMLWAQSSTSVIQDAAQPKAPPFAVADDISWAPGAAGSDVKPWSLGAFEGEFRVDTAYHYSLNNPQDHTLSGSSEALRHHEVQITQLGVGGNFNYQHVHGRLMTQFGVYSQSMPRNDASAGRGQYALADAYRYLSEAYGGYHVDALGGINIQAGIFVSYIGLWSYYNADNWTYQPSFIASSTPWSFNGIRAQIYVSDTFKVEPWLVNGWQSYGSFNQAPGFGVQTSYRPYGWLQAVANQYYGSDTLGNARRRRIHTDDSVMVKYYQSAHAILNKAAASITADAGCEWGGGVSCNDQYFLGVMAYNRLWFYHDTFATTLGGGMMTNPGRYLVLLPPINGATASSGTPYFTTQHKDPFVAWDMQATLDFMPRPFLTLRLEYTHRAVNTPYFSGPGGVTPPGGNQGPAGSAVVHWAPNLVNTENRFTLALLLKL